MATTTRTSGPRPSVASVPSSAAPSAPRLIAVLAIRPVLILALGLILLAAGLPLVHANALVVLVDLVTLAVVALALRAEGRSLLDLFRPWRWVDLAWGALMLVILLVGFLASNIVANLIVHGGAPPTGSAMPEVPLWVGVIAVTIAPLTIAVAEEAVYRGYAQPRLARRLGTPLALTLVAIVFGIQHIGFVLTSPADVAAKVLTTLLAGLILGALMVWMKRIAPLVLGHWGLDLLLLGLPTLALALL